MQECWYQYDTDTICAERSDIVSNMLPANQAAGPFQFGPV